MGAAEQTTSAAVVSIRLMDIRTDGGTQTRAQLCQATVERYASSAKTLPPVDVYYDGEHYWLSDGFHRVEAWETAGLDLVTARVYQGTQRDAVLASCGANADHGLVRTNDDARRAVERVLRDAEWTTRSDRWIAEQCRVSHSWVGRIRAELGAHASVRTYEREGVTRHIDLEAKAERAAERGLVDSESSRNPASAESTFQAPEPDNTVRTPVEREHKGAPLTDEQIQGMRDLRKAGWPLDKLADKYRMTWQDVADICTPPPGAGEEAEPIASNDVENPETAPSEASTKRFDASPKDSPGTRYTDRDLKLSQWWTPPDLATYLVQWAGIKAGDHVLEPAAGTGRLVAALLAVGATVEAHEIDTFWHPQLRARGALDVLEVFDGDYLATEPLSDNDGNYAYPWGCTNPPYENGADGAFIARLLEECEQVVALVRVNIFLGSGRFKALWKAHGPRLAKVEFIVSRPDFADGEEGFDGALSDFVLLHFDGEERPPGGVFGWLVDKFGGGA